MSEPICLLKKNLKIPTSMKLIGRLTSNSFEIFKKKLEMSFTGDQALLKVNFGHGVEAQIIRESTNKVLVKSKKEHEEWVELIMPSSYERDLFVLLFRRLNQAFTEGMGKSGQELREIDFFKKREQYLQRQLESTLAKLRKSKQDEQKSAETIEKLECELENSQMHSEDLRSQSVKKDDILNGMQQLVK